MLKHEEGSLFFTSNVRVIFKGEQDWKKGMEELVSVLEIQRLHRLKEVGSKLRIKYRKRKHGNSASKKSKLKINETQTPPKNGRLKKDIE